MIFSRSFRSFVVLPCCVLLTLCLVSWLSTHRIATAKNPATVSGMHQEGTITITFHQGILEELGWDVPSGVEPTSVDDPAQSVFSILPWSTLIPNYQSSSWSGSQGEIETRGTFLISVPHKFYQVSQISVEARANGFWYVTASVPGNTLGRIEFDFLPDIVQVEAATVQATISGELCLAESSALALGASRYQGTCFARLSIDSALIDDDKSTRWSIDNLTKTSTSKTFAKVAGLCLSDVDCPAGLICDTSDGACKNGPDLIVGDIQSLFRWGRESASGISAYSIGTTSCNIGDMPANWFSREDGLDYDQLHPVIAQNIHRYNEEQRDGNGVVQRPSSLEHIGMSWIKHGFTADTRNDCNPAGVFCDLSAGENFLGVNCSDAYNSGLNGFQSNLGPRFEVNPVTGEFACWDQRDPITDDCTPAPDLCFPCSSIVDTPTAITRRIQIHDNDLLPDLNLDSHYIVEAHYISLDDAQAQNDDNNSSYREFNVVEAFPMSFIFSFSSISGKPTQRMKSPIQAWQDFDPTVDIQSVDVINDGRFLVAAKATNMGDGTWHYEYAIQNLNSDRCGQSFSVPIPINATVISSGFHDIDSHSNSPYSSVDWTPLESGGSITWSTDTQAVDPFANALRWGTIYNFRFVTDVCPTTGDATLGLFKPLASDPDSVLVTTIVPGDCATCEGAITLVSADPILGFVDVLQPTQPDGSNATGIRQVDLTYDAYPDCSTPLASDYQVSQLGGMGIVPSPDTASIQPDSSIRITLTSPINPGASTTVTHILSGSGIELGFLPGDVNRDDTTNPIDLTALTASLGSLSLPLSDSDMDRDGSTSTSDLLRLIDLLQGAGMYEVWDGKSLP